jgi:pyruvate formate lyase activating enzyme
MPEITARIHSVETFGTQDGPGIRYVIFFQGCPLRCLYCHNRDTWNSRGGQEKTLHELIDDITQYKDFYLASGGGVTASGGEPALQAGFLFHLFSACRGMGLNTAIDTSGCTGPKPLVPLLPVTDLVLLDIKHINPAKHKVLTGVSNKRALELARFLSLQKKAIWVRFVLIPGYTDDSEDIRRLAEFLQELTSLEKVEVLPYHTLGAYKWEELGLVNPLQGVEPPDPAKVAEAKAILSDHGLPVK